LLPSIGGKNSCRKRQQDLHLLRKPEFTRNEQDKPQSVKGTEEKGKESSPRT